MPHPFAAQKIKLALESLLLDIEALDAHPEYTHASDLIRKAMRCVAVAETELHQKKMRERLDPLQARIDSYAPGVAPIEKRGRGLQDMTMITHNDNTIGVCRRGNDCLCAPTYHVAKVLKCDHFQGIECRELDELRAKVRVEALKTVPPEKWSEIYGKG